MLIYSPLTIYVATVSVCHALTPVDSVADFSMAGTGQGNLSGLVEASVGGVWLVTGPHCRVELDAAVGFGRGRAAQLLPEAPVVRWSVNPEPKRGTT